MDKIFIGKVATKEFDNGGSIIRLTLNADDKKKLNPDGFDTIEIKKSMKGNWYAELSQYQPPIQRHNAGYGGNAPSHNDDNDNDLPF